MPLALTTANFATYARIECKFRGGNSFQDICDMGGEFFFPREILRDFITSI